MQDAFHDDARVLTISIHEANRWPFTGTATDRAGGAARNLPVPQGFNDSEMHHLLTEAILPLIERARPQAIFLQCGADALEEDPLARLSLSNNAHWGVVQAIMPLAPRLLVTGGGGYNPYTVGRCWAGVWATLNHLPIPDCTTPAAEAVLRALTYNRAAGRNPPAHWFTTLRDAPPSRPHPRRDRPPRPPHASGDPAMTLPRRLFFVLPLLACAAQAQTTAQPELPKEPLTITTRDGAKHAFMVEMALSGEQQTLGLMFRPTVPPDGGMLFDWGTPRDSTMWMRNTVAPLDMVFINADGSIRRIAEDTVPESLAIVESRGPRPRHPRTRRRHRPPPRPPPWRPRRATDLRRRIATGPHPSLRVGPSVGRPVPLKIPSPRA